MSEHIRFSKLFRKAIKLLCILIIGLSILIVPENAWGYLAASCTTTDEDYQQDEIESHAHRTYQAGTVLGLIA